MKKTKTIPTHSPPSIDDISPLELTGESYGDDELVTLVDENDSVIGSAKKSEVHTKKLIHRGVCVLVYNKKGQILVHKRSRDMAVFPSTWDLFITGHVTYNEPYQESALREVREEIGVDPGNLQYIDSFYCDLPEDKWHGQFFIFQCDSPIVVQRSEIEEEQWIPLGKLESFMASHTFSKPRQIIYGKIKHHIEELIQKFAMDNAASTSILDESITQTGKSCDKLYHFVKQSVQYDMSVLQRGHKGYCQGLKDELLEVEHECNQKKIHEHHLQEELGDIMIDYLHLVAVLEQKYSITLHGALQDALKKLKHRKPYVEKKQVVDPDTANRIWQEQKSKEQGFGKSKEYTHE